MAQTETGRIMREMMTVGIVLRLNLKPLYMSSRMAMNFSIAGSFWRGDQGKEGQEMPTRTLR